jgi:hypothetical protein
MAPRFVYEMTLAEVAAFIIAIASFSGCGAVGSTSLECAVAHNVYQKDAQNCAGNNLVACGSLVQEKCEAKCGACSDEFPQLQSQAREKLSGACRSGDQAGCRGLDAIGCDSGDQGACGRLNDQYSKLADACHSGNQDECAKIASSPWARTMRADATAHCNSGDAAACAQLKGSATLDTL